MKKNIDRQLLAYIQHKGSDEVFIDVVKVSKAGTSFLYEGKVWNRPMLMRSAFCIDPHGNECEITPLSRSYTPSQYLDKDIPVKECAQARYNLWVGKKIKSERD